eukprot:scaffold2194_cov130-Cylindrotheca_fusiformis.AAC.5
MSGNDWKGLKNIVSAADHALLEDKYEFIPSEKKPNSWQDRMVERYHNGLYKEFALADLTRPGKIGLRWRTKQEVIQGRGEKTCGNKKCQSKDDLITLEVPFTYMEAGISKKELVKLRLCSLCKPLVAVNSSPKQNMPPLDSQSGSSKPASSYDSGDSREGKLPPRSRHKHIPSHSGSSRHDRRSRKRRRRRERDVDSSDSSRSANVRKKTRKRSHGKKNDD